MTKQTWTLALQLVVIVILAITSWSAHRRIDDLVGAIGALGLDARGVERLRGIEAGIEAGIEQINEQVTALEERTLALELANQIRVRPLTQGPGTAVLPQPPPAPAPSGTRGGVLLDTMHTPRLYTRVR